MATPGKERQGATTPIDWPPQTAIREGDRASGNGDAMGPPAPKETETWPVMVRPLHTAALKQLPVAHAVTAALWVWMANSSTVLLRCAGSPSLRWCAASRNSPDTWSPPVGRQGKARCFSVPSSLKTRVCLWSSEAAPAAGFKVPAQTGAGQLGRCTIVRDGDHLALVSKCLEHL